MCQGGARRYVGPGGRRPVRGVHGGPVGRIGAGIVVVVCIRVGAGSRVGACIRIGAGVRIGAISGVGAVSRVGACSRVVACSHIVACSRVVACSHIVACSRIGASTPIVTPNRDKPVSEVVRAKTTTLSAPSCHLWTPGLTDTTIQSRALAWGWVRSSSRLLAS